MNEEDLRLHALKSVPTRVLLKEFQKKMKLFYKGWCDMDDTTKFVDDWWMDARCKVIVGKFAYWNPNKGKSYTFYYTLNETKSELDTREHIK